MKKLFLILTTLFAYSLSAQTLQNPTFGNTTTNTLKIKTPATVTSVNFLPAFGSDEITISKIDPVNLGFASDANVLHKTGNETKTGDLNIVGNVGIGLSTGIINSFEAKVSSSTGISSSNGFAVHDGQTIRRGVNLGVNTVLDYSWIQSAEGLAPNGNTLAVNPNGGQILLGKNTINGTANVQIKQTVSGPTLLLDNDARPNYIEFSKTGYTDRVSVGALGNLEANLSYNMDYASGVHKYYDPSKNAMWLAMNETVYAMQFSPSGQPVGGDMWNSSGNRYLFLGDSDGRLALNTNLSTNRGDSQMMINRISGKASLSGATDLLLEGHNQSGTAGTVYTNSLSTGNTLLSGGGGNVAIGTNVTPSNKLEVKVVTSTGASGSDGISINDGAAAKLNLNLGVNTSGAYTWLQSSKGGVGVMPFMLNPNGGGVAIGATVNPGNNNLGVAGKVTAGSPATSANDLERKGEHDADLALKQNTLVSGTNIKTVGGQNILGSGNLTEVQNSMTASTVLAPSATAVNAAISAAVTSGTYTPVLSNTTNVSSTTASGTACTFYRVGDIVNVSIPLTTIVTAGLVGIVITGTLPVNRVSITPDLAGVGVIAPSGSTNYSPLRVQMSNNTTQFTISGVPGSMGSSGAIVQFSYKVN